MTLSQTRAAITVWFQRLKELSGSDMPVQAAKRYRRGQIRGTIEQMRLLLAGNTVFAPALSMQAWNTGANGVVIAWTVVMLVFSWGLFLSWRKTYQTDGAARDMRLFKLQTVANSSLWCLGMVLFYPLVEGDAKTIITTIMAGSLAIGTVGFSRAPEVAFIYLGILTVTNTAVALVTGIMTGASVDYLVAFLSLVAGISLFNAVVERGFAALKGFKDHEQISEKSEVIELLLKDYEEQTTQWLWQTDAQGQTVSAPAQILELLDRTACDFANLPLIELIAKAASPDSSDGVEKMTTAFEQWMEFYDVELSIETQSSNGPRWILMKGRPQFDMGEFKGFRGIFADATVSVNADRRIKFLANFDSLTKLYNRNSVQKRLSELNPDTDICTAILIDLDGFKQVNDSYGHAVGDQLLKVVADRLRKIEDDNSWSARLGGDEFLMLSETPKARSHAALSWLADEINEALSRPFQVGSFNIQLSASIGLARYPEDTHKGTDLLLLSDLALYEAKARGRNRAEFYDQDMRNRLGRRTSMMERLKIAVRSGTIMPHYQSQHRLSDGRLIGFEALARWFDEELGRVGPDQFIPIAEQTGLIVELGEQLLRQACKDAFEWASEMGDDAPVVSVNISPIQFARMDMAALVAQVLKETRLPPHLLEIEVTEGVLISDKERITAALAEISELGVSIALDDFGTGYSSLSYLRELPLNRLKIDRSFVMALDDGDASPVLDMIIQLGHSLGLSVIAEGVEGEGHIGQLASMGCDDGQGYFYSRPMPVEETSDFMQLHARPAQIATQ